MIRTVFYVFLAAICPRALSQADPSILYQQGKQAYDGGDCITAYPNLYAFQQISPPGAITGSLAQMLPMAIDYCRVKLDFALKQVPQLQAEVDRLRGVGSIVRGLENKPQLPASLVSVSPQTYPLRCRGGGLPVTIDGGTARIGFNTSGVASDSNQLPSGNCGWLDRPMSPNEPRTICHIVTARPPVSFVQGKLSAPRPWAYFARLEDSAAILTFQVANDGRGCMVATIEPSVTTPASVLKDSVIRRKAITTK